MKRAFLLIGLFLTAGVLRAEVDPLKKVAAELAEGLKHQKHANIAVLTVPYYDQHASDGPFVVSERLATALCHDNRLSVLERNQMAQALSELHLSQTGVLDAASAQRIGKALGADILITGTLIDLNDKKTEVNIRAMLAENGRVLCASRAVINQSWGGRRNLAW